jgi:hypothetical protein
MRNRLLATRQCSYIRVQGDQIGRVFRPSGDSLISGSCFKIKKSSPKFLASFFTRLRSCINFWRKMFGLQLGRFFSQTHLVTLFECSLWKHHFFRKPILPVNPTVKPENRPSRPAVKYIHTRFKPRLPDFSCQNKYKIYPNNHKICEPNVHKIYEMAVK